MVGLVRYRSEVGGRGAVAGYLAVAAVVVGLGAAAVFRRAEAVPTPRVDGVSGPA